MGQLPAVPRRRGRPSLPRAQPPLPTARRRGALAVPTAAASQRGSSGSGHLRAPRLGKPTGTWVGTAVSHMPQLSLPSRQVFGRRALPPGVRHDRQPGDTCLQVRAAHGHPLRSPTAPRWGAPQLPQHAGDQLSPPCPPGTPPTPGLGRQLPAAGTASRGLRGG